MIYYIQTIIFKDNPYGWIFSDDDMQVSYAKRVRLSGHILVDNQRINPGDVLYMNKIGKWTKL